MTKGDGASMLYIKSNERRFAMNDIQDQDVTCDMDESCASSYEEVCCCYVEMDDESYENPCDETIDDCCCC